MVENRARGDAIDVGLIGLVVMGSAMGRNIRGAGHRVVGFDIDADRRADFAGRAVAGERGRSDERPRG